MIGKVEVWLISMLREGPALITYDPQYLRDFVSLNREWIERHFVVETMDLYQLENPEETILKPGGEIFFILENGCAVGTCAMVPHHHPKFELAKMAVSPQVRGKGYGDLLMRAVKDWAKARGAKSILILSNTVLAPAIALYKKHGAQVIHLGTHPDYDRCNIEMHLPL